MIYVSVKLRCIQTDLNFGVTSTGTKCRVRTQKGLSPFGGLTASYPAFICRTERNTDKKSSGDEIPNANFLRRHRTCTGQGLRLL